MSRPPISEQAEAALLGALLIDNREFARLAGVLRPESFGVGAHGRIFEAIATLVERGEIANPVTLAATINGDPAFAALGGAKYLAKLATSAVTIRNAEDYGRHIADLAKRRALIAACERLIDRAGQADLEHSAEDLIEGHQSVLEEIAGYGLSSGIGEARTLGEAAREAMARTEAAYKAGGEITGLPTGLIDLDRKLNGLQPGDLIIVGARPSIGKTSWLSGVASHIARQGVPVGIFELEQSAEQLAQRELAGISGVSTMRQRRGDLDLVHWQNLVEAGAELGGLPVYVDDVAGLTIGQIRQRARRLKQRRGVGMIGIDHIQLIRGAGEGEGGRRLDEMSRISATLKIIAKELSIPVVALSQLSRNLESREDKRPMLADLRETGALEQDADVVIFLFRESYYLSREEPRRRPNEADEKFNDRTDAWKRACEEAHGIAELLVAKQREGPTGTVKVRWDQEIMKFSDLGRGDF